MFEVAPINMIQETSFHRAWQRAAAFIYEYGSDRIIGDINERKPIRDSRQLISLTGKAIMQMREGEMHPKFPFGPKALAGYCVQFTRDYVQSWKEMEIDDPHRFKYLYLERMLFPFDQLKAIKENLADQVETSISSNRTQAITWRPAEDAYNNEPPCLQRYQIMYLGTREDGVSLVEQSWDWRSRDINAWQSNKICLSRLMDREILQPNNCIVVRDVDYCASLHCYQDRLDKLREAAWYNRQGNNFLIDSQN